MKNTIRKHFVVGGKSLDIDIGVKYTNKVLDKENSSKI